MPTFTAKNTQKAPQQAPKQFNQNDEKKSFPLLPEAIYNAVVSHANYRNRQDWEAQGKTWPGWVKYDHEVSFGFKITDETGRNRVFWKNCEVDLSEGSDLRILLQEITGLNPLPDDFEFDTDELDYYEGLDCRIRLNQFYSKKEQADKNGLAEVLASTNSFADADDYF